MKKLLIIFAILTGAGLIIFGGAAIAGFRFDNIKDFYLSDYQYGEREVYDASAGLTGIKMDIESRRVEFVSTDDDHIKFDYRLREKDVFKVDEVDSKLIITLSEPLRFFNLPASKDCITMTVYLPKTVIYSLDVEVDSGNILLDFSSVVNFQDVKLVTKSGGITVNNIASSAFGVSCNSGSIKLNNIETESDVVISNKSGSITIENFESKSLLVTDKSGRVTLGNVETQNDITIDNNSGNVNATAITARNFKVSVDSGKTTLNDLNITENVNAESSSGSIIAKNVMAKSINYKCSSGGVDIDYTTTVTLKMELRTSSGNIKINGNRSGEYYHTDTGDISLNVKVSSGNIRVDF